MASFQQFIDQQSLQSSAKFEVGMAVRERDGKYEGIVIDKPTTRNQMGFVGCLSIRITANHQKHPALQRAHPVGTILESVPSRNWTPAH